MLAAERAANCARVVTPRRCRVTARSGRARVATDHGPRKSAVPPDGTISSARAASMTAKSPSATPMRASSPTTPARRATTASSPPKNRAGPRAGSAPTPRRTGWTHGQSSPACSRTRANGPASSPFAPSSRSSGHQMTTNRSTSPPPLRSGRLRPVTGTGSHRPAPLQSGPCWLSGPGRLVLGVLDRARAGGEPERALADPAGGAAAAHPYLGPAALQVPVAAADALPLDRPDRERQVAALGPGPGAFEQDDERRLALAGAGRQVTRRGQAGSPGRADQDGVDPREEVPGRLGPSVAGVGNEDD